MRVATTIGVILTALFVGTASAAVLDVSVFTSKGPPFFTSMSPPHVAHVIV